MRARVLLHFWIFFVIFKVEVLAGDCVETTGDILRFAIPGSALLFSLYEKDYAGVKQFSGAMLISQGTTLGLKLAIDKERPNGECCDSFPSGHASAAFTGASYLHMRYGFKYAVVAYAGAVYVGYSRVYAKKHYTEDVIAGAAIGIASSYLVTSKRHRVSVFPMFSERGYLISVFATW